MRKIATAAAIILLVAMFSLAAAIAQEGTETPSVEQDQLAIETDMAYGEIQAIDLAGSTVAIREYDYETDQYIDSTYVISKEVKIEGDVTALSEIKAGDFLDVEYKANAGVKTAVYLYVERPQAQIPTDDMPASMNDETEEM